MRLCEHEGQFLPGAYAALSYDMSWGEAQRVLTCMTVLGDERGDYNEWWLANSKRLRALAGRSKTVNGNVTLDDYMRELDENRQGLANVEEDLSKHRSAVAQGLGESAGLKDPTEVDFLEKVRALHANKIDAIEEAIAELLAPESANLPEG